VLRPDLVRGNHVPHDRKDAQHRQPGHMHVRVGHKLQQDGHLPPELPLRIAEQGLGRLGDDHLGPVPPLSLGPAPKQPPERLLFVRILFVLFPLLVLLSRRQFGLRGALGRGRLCRLCRRNRPCLRGSDRRIPVLRLCPPWADASCVFKARPSLGNERGLNEVRSGRTPRVCDAATVRRARVRLGRHCSDRREKRFHDGLETQQRY